MPIIQMPDGQKVNFPDTMSREQITQLVYQKYPELNTQPEQPEWAKRIADKMVEEGRTDLTLGEKAEAIGRGLAGGFTDLAKRSLAGSTFGLSDWAARKAGLNPTKGIEDMIDSTKSDRVAGAIGLLSGLTEMSGSFGTGGALYKGVGKGLSAVPKAGKYIKYATPAVSGAITGGAYRGFETDSLDEAKKGAVRGAILGTAIDLGARGLNKALSSMEKVKGVKRGLSNTVESDKGTEVLNRAVKEDKRIAKEIYGQAPYAQKQVNQKIVDKYNKMTEMPLPENRHNAIEGVYGKPQIGYKIERADELPKVGVKVRIGGGTDDAIIYPRRVDVAGMKADAGRVYGDYLEANKGNQVVQGKITPKEYKANLRKWGGDSLVLDENGKPLKLYHGTSSNFDSFKADRPIFTNDNLDIASEYGSEGAIPLYGKMKKPFIVDAYGQDFREIYNASGVKKPYKELTAKDYKKIADTFFNGDVKEAKSWFPKNSDGQVNLARAYGQKPMSTNEWAKFAKENGYDGLIIKDVIDSPNITNIRTNDYVFFDPKQLKSVNNTGAFTNSSSLTDKNVKIVPKVSDIGINDQLSPFQKQALNKAWNEGAMQLKKGEAIGSMKHIDYMKRNLNTQIEQSMEANASGVGKVATDKTVPLQELKSLLKETTNKAVPPEISQQYALAKNVERAYNEGLGFQPNSIKTRNLTFGTPEEKSAFTQGLLEKMMTNESNTNISKEILKNQDVLKRVMPERNFKVLIGNAEKGNLSYERLEGLMSKARTKTGAAEAIGKYTGNITEWGDSKAAPFTALLNAGRRFLTANSSGRAARYLLNADLPVKVPLYDTIQKYLPSSAVILKESKVKRKENK